MAWQHILPDVTVYSFEKCHIPNAMDGIDDDMLWDDSVEEWC